MSVSHSFSAVGRIPRRAWVLVTAFFGLAATAFSGQPAWSEKALSGWERHCLWRVSCLAESHGLTFEQAFTINRYLDEQRDVMELFGRFGLLDMQAQQRKMREIHEVTALNIEVLLSPQQRELWRQWENQFSARKAISRSGDGLFQGRGTQNLFSAGN